jgi:hypothetical protein
MPKNSESLNRSLFNLLHSKGFDPTMLDTSGKEIPTPEEAEVFQFNFIKDGEDYGKVTISIDGLHKLCVYFSDEVANSEKEETHGEDESWYKVLNQLKRFAQKYQLSFELKNIDHLKHDMAKREYMKKQERISEGYYPMGKKTSYNDAVPNVKIVIQHTRQIEEGEQRYRNIAKIFLENSEGERFLAPTIKPGVARVYGRLIAEGDKPHGERWNHVTSLVEEYQKMGAFVRATRNGQFNESAQRLVNEGINHYQGLRETLSRMTGHRGYNTYFESWTPSLMEDETEENNLNELFVQETLDPRIESVMPILNKLQKKVAEMKEVGELSEWADSLTEAPGAETLGHNVRTDAKNLRAFDLEEDDMDEGAAVDAYMAGKSPALAHFADKLDKEIDEGFDDIDDPVVSSITRRIIRQHPELLKHGPDKVLAAIADVADFVGDVEEIGSSDVSGWVKQVARQLNGVDEGMMDTIKKAGSKVFDKLGGGSEEDLLKDLQKKAGVPQTGKKPEFDAKAKQLARTNSGDPVGDFAKGGKDLGIFKEDDVEESALQASFGIKKYGKKGMDKLRAAGKKHASKKTMQNIRAHYSNKEEPVTEDGEFAGNYATGEAGQWRNKGPKANKPATIGDLVGEGTGNLAKAISKLGGWYQEDSLDPNIEKFEYDDREGGYYASGSIEHNLKTGEIEIHFQDSESDEDIDGTFNSIGDAMNALRGGYPGSHGGRAQNYDSLANKTLFTPDDVYKTDRAGKKGTLSKSRMDGMKASSAYTMRGGPKGVLPEGQEDLDTIKRLLKK